MLGKPDPQENKEQLEPKEMLVPRDLLDDPEHQVS
jgi:hypothetical protein